MAMMKTGTTNEQELLLFQGREAQVLDFCFVVAGADGDEAMSKISGAPFVVSVRFRGSHVIIAGWPITQRSQTVMSATTVFLCALMHADASGTANWIPDWYVFVVQACSACCLQGARRRGLSQGSHESPSD
ncbi:hypothetical protein COCCADRAFT_25399 [Bipolaris zeicola 26-R-13]|uniref:Uncharacterized protein n=1 Tax=Cochliobolus carbonum (strain 26-R-13) TaxID=930089 RepID=W6Y479_COCC2|nr:uncharacterized protein COCCADRAFT_25399 [Bipolaris zeicola 26-R-13]EUC34527.1 hypothetical protein COCCADRAFT_25399 [Bipolaris zeicola 26-R-13]